MSEMIKTVGGLYTPEELASAHAERGERIENLERDKAFLERRNAELETVAEAVTTLVNFAAKDEDLNELRSDLNELRSDLDDVEDTSSKLDDVVRAMRDAAAELASV